ncbi:MAG TPA: hypothetical protein VM406_03815 [Noviherbaspirillum sp.]|nr:hypothetical protein [Noviherbaspirillum sp.]
MQNTIIAVYDDYNDAEATMKELLLAGFSRTDVQLNPHADSTGVDRASSVDEQTGGHAHGIGHFFRSLFGMEDTEEEEGRFRRDMYAEAIRRGSSLVTVHADRDDQLEMALAILRRHNPVDLDKRSEHWRREGWSGFEESAPHYTGEQSRAERMRHAAASADPQAGPAGAGPASRSDAGLHVIRRRPAGGAAQEANARSARAAARADDFGDTVASADDADYRTHWENVYGRTGRRYEDYDAAYRYGALMGGSHGFRNYRWEDAEPRMRSDWEARNPGSSWEQVRDAVRYGAEKGGGSIR